MPVLHRLDYYSFVVSFEIVFNLFFLFKMVLAILGPLHLHSDFRISMSFQEKKKK